MIFRCILAHWAKEKSPELPKVQEGEFSEDRIHRLNSQGYNIYFLPNSPSHYEKGRVVEGSHIDQFNFVFVDMDLKDGSWPDKISFVEILKTSDILPSFIVDSGNGIHAYWQVTDLDAKNFLRLQRRLCDKFVTDPTMAKIYQLMRVPGTFNTKLEGQPKLCESIYTGDSVYTCEELDRRLPPLSQEDETYCEQHYDKTYNLEAKNTKVSDQIPPKFLELLTKSKEAKEIWAGNVEDRSAADYRLGHLMFAAGFSKDEARSVLVNSAKAISRAPIHRIGYADGIIDKIWTFEIDKTELNLSSTVKQILSKHEGDSIKGTRFPCWRYLDATEHGFRLGQVIGLVAGSGVGKTAMALNMFEGFVQNNPDYEHFFIPLEQPANEIADRWRTMCGEKTHLHDKVHVLSNYNDDGSFRHLSFDEIKDYILKFQKLTNKKVGCVVIDHIGALNKAGKNGENQDLMNICHKMKAFAVATNTLLVMQSQAPREKAGIGDIELNKDAAYGTVFFESYVDFLVTIWQPLKRQYSIEGCPKITAFKFCKIRHKRSNTDKIQEDVRYLLNFDPDTERMREMLQSEDESFRFFNNKATNDRKKDSKRDLIEYTTIEWTNKNAS